MSAAEQRKAMYARHLGLNKATAANKDAHSVTISTGRIGPSNGKHQKQHPFGSAAKALWLCILPFAAYSSTMWFADISDIILKLDPSLTSYRGHMVTAQQASANLLSCF